MTVESHTTSLPSLQKVSRTKDDRAMCIAQNVVQHCDHSKWKAIQLLFHLYKKNLEPNMIWWCTLHKMWFSTVIIWSPYPVSEPCFFISCREKIISYETAYSTNLINDLKAICPVELNDPFNSTTSSPRLGLQIWFKLATYSLYPFTKSGTQSSTWCSLGIQTKIRNNLAGPTKWILKLRWII